MRANKRNAGPELKPHGNNSSVSLPSRTIKTRARAERGTKKGHSGACYKPLPTRLRRNGFDYRQIAREGNAAIYEQMWGGCSNPSVAYEVVRIRRREATEIAGNFIEPHEVYPSDANVGTGNGIVGQDQSPATPQDPISRHMESIRNAESWKTNEPENHAGSFGPWPEEYE